MIMSYALSYTIIAIFLVLSAIHWNWVFGGKWGFEQALPTNEKGERVLNPGKKDSAIVGMGLLLFALFYLVRTILPLSYLPPWLFNYGGLIISGIFLLRAIGDFRYIGFFKKVRGTEFATNDSRYYSPLCILISIIGTLIEFWWHLHMDPY